MSNFVWSDETFPCFGCVNAHYSDCCRNTPFLWCNEARCFITPKSSSWICHNEHYKSKFSSFEKNNIVKCSGQIPGQLTLEGIIF